jgi:transposase-like protein
MRCTHCGSANIKKNGQTHYGKQNHYCHDCKRQFVESGQEWFVSDLEKKVINKLLLSMKRYQRYSREVLVFSRINGRPMSRHSRMRTILGQEKTAA